MDRNQLLSYAILNVNDSNNIDYYDHFVPFIKESLLKSGMEIISANELKQKIKEQFKIDLPINVVNTILRKKMLRTGYIYREEKKLIPNYEKLQDSDFQKIKIRMMERHDKLIQDIILFAQQRYGVEIEEEETEKALESFLDKHQSALLETSLNGTISSNSRKEVHIGEMEIIISQFIKNSYELRSVSFDYLIDIVKGNMLTNALYYKSDLNMAQMKFKGTEVYFDSTFLIYALGHGGKARQEPCLELIQMLRSNNAILKVFRHTIDEISGILEWCKNKLTTSTADPHGTISNFLDKGYGQSDIERIIYALDNELEEKLRIRIVESVDYNNHKYVISHEELNDYLRQNIIYRKDNARERDVQSISAIIRLRRGKKSFHIENCRAIFVTNNYTLAQNIKDYFFDEDNPRLIPPILHDSVITNLMWLKNPSDAPDLPRIRLIAETYAATHPKEHLWNRYIETVNILERTNEITEEDIVRLRYSQGAREMLVEKTLGDEDAITIGTVQEILAEIKNEEQRKLNELNKEKEMEIELLKSEIRKTREETANSINNIGENISRVAEKRAKILTNSLFVFIAICIALLIYSTPLIQSLDMNFWIKTIILLGIITGPSLLGLFDINLLPFKKGINNYFIKRFKKSIENKYL